jgi:hypothetical protein
MRAMTIAFPASILLSLAAAAQDQGRNAAGRQTSPPASVTGQGLPEAPVGHRQPTEKSLPPAVRKEEDARRQPADPLGPIPSICRNC